tara:strand:- start:501 stop:947 length:447 start_codon:yes stop_codon:yes gene_type:complete
MCLKNSKLKELMEDYPDANKFYRSRAWHRRIELRRRMKKHLQKLALKNNVKNKKAKDKKEKEGVNDVGLDDKEDDSFEESHSSFEDSEDYESEEDNDNSDIGDISGSNSDSNENPAANRKLKKQMNKKDKSKFFYDVDPLKELTNDID